MLSREKLSSEHVELGGIAGEIMRLIGQATPPMAELSALRWRLSRVLMVHLAREDGSLYPALRRSADATTRSLAAQFEAQMGTLAQDYRDYAARWPADAIGADWSQFGAETRRILQALKRRIQREEIELYPRITARAAAEPVTSE